MTLYNRPIILTHGFFLQYKGCIDITMGSKCVTGKRKTYSFPFVLMTKKGKHLFKCESTVQRHKWMYAIGLVSKVSA